MHLFSSSFFFYPSKVMSSLTLFCLWSVAHGLRADRRMYLLAYIGADEFKRCCGMERVTIAAQRQTVAVSNCCTVMNPDPCTERSVRRWIPFSLPDPGRDCASVIMCIFHAGSHQTQGETFSRSTKALTDVKSLLLLFIVLIIINEASIDSVLWLHLRHTAHCSCHSLIIDHLSLHSQFSPSLWKGNSRTCGSRRMASLFSSSFLQSQEECHNKNSR